MVEFVDNELVDRSGFVQDSGVLKQGYSRDAPQHSLYDGLVGHWPLHEQSGRANDLSGNENHGSVSGATQGVAGRGGLTAYSFKGSNSYVSIPNFGIYDGSQSFAWTAWVNVSFDSTYQNIISATSENNTDLRVSDSNDLEFHFRDGGGTDNIITYTGLTEGWHHVVVTWDPSGNAVVYVDGSNVTSTTTSSSIASDSGNSGIGAVNYGSGWSNYFNGEICDTRVYNRAISPEEVSTFYEWGTLDSARPPTDGVAYYPLDGDVVDEWGSNDGTNNGVNFVNDSIRGQAGDFQQSNRDNITLTDTITLDNSDGGEWSISYWYYQTQNAAMVMGVKGEDANRLYHYDTPSYHIKDNSETVYEWTNFKTIKNSWNHIILRCVDGNITIYQNGNPLGTKSTSDNILVSNIGAPYDRSGYAWDGYLDDLRIYDYALSPLQVYELYRWGTRGRDMRTLMVRQ